MRARNDNIIRRQSLNAAQMEVVVGQDIIPITQHPFQEADHEEICREFPRPLEAPVHVVWPHVEDRSLGRAVHDPGPIAMEVVNGQAQVAPAQHAVVIVGRQQLHALWERDVRGLGLIVHVLVAVGEVGEGREDEGDLGFRADLGGSHEKSDVVTDVGGGRIPDFEGVGTRAEVGRQRDFEVRRPGRVV